jgi:mRNA-degrading endonuclease RelE of RelBE toxin-antitoxin system
MNQRYELAITTTFGRMLAALPPKAQEQVWRKLPELQADPHPDGTERKQRVENFDDVYRWRVGKYRVFYRIANSRIILMAIEHRRDAYRHDTLPSDDQLILIEPDDQFELPTLGDSAPADGDVEPLPAVPTSPPGDPLPRPLAEPELARLGVPADQCGPLAACRTVDELLEVLERLPQAVADRVLALALGTTLEKVLDDPVLLLDELPPSFVDVLRGHVPLRYLLDPSQEEALQRISNQDGPFLVTGPPGSGKTLLGLLAISPLLARARQRGNPQPRALFVTFTRTLARTLERLARVHLSAADRLAVAFKTLDSLVNDLAPDALLADGTGGRHARRPSAPTRLHATPLARSRARPQARWLAPPNHQPIHSRGDRRGHSRSRSPHTRGIPRGRSHWSPASAQCQPA